MEKLGFIIQLEYIENKDNFNKFKKIGNYTLINNRPVWFFPIEKLNEIIPILNKKMEFTESDVLTAINYCPPLIEKLKLAPEKGLSGIEVVRYLKFYEVIEHRKVDGVVKEIKHTIPIETINSVWNVIKTYEKNKWMKGAQVARDIVVYMNRTDWIVKEIKDNNEITHFDWCRFWSGKGRAKGYFPLFYYPIKILENFGVIKYSDRGKILRVKDDFQV